MIITNCKHVGSLEEYNSFLYEIYKTVNKLKPKINRRITKDNLLETEIVYPRMIHYKNKKIEEEKYIVTRTQKNNGYDVKITKTICEKPTPLDVG